VAYQSLYRKYRPQTFADVMGQGHVVRTLQNALTSGKIAHGYLFTGTRGTAKTTIARLLAKALNCQAASKPVAEPCNACDACRSITAGGQVDVVELDAASHRGVADIEEVRKQVGYGPMELRYKVFIIDEAHQLSNDAKDAFLKTLEEPPDNVVFVLATTEPQAIPITIRSRCQQFDFKRGSLTEITSRLRYVLDCEGVSYTPEAVSLVARGAEGSYRDSLSLLEQVLAFSPKELTPETVNAVLGSLDSVMLERVVCAVSECNAPETFALAGELLDAGKEARTLLKTLAAHFRDLLLVSVGGPAVAAELTPDEVTRLQEQARRFTPQQMTRAMDILSEAQAETRWSNQHRLLIELTFLKLMTLGEGAGNGAVAAMPTLQTAPIVFSPATVVVAPPVPAVRPASEPEPDDLPPAFYALQGTDPEDDYTPEESEEPAQDTYIVAEAEVAPPPLPVVPLPSLAAPETEPEEFAEPVLPKPFEGDNLFGDEDAVEEIPTIIPSPHIVLPAAPESEVAPQEVVPHALLSDLETPPYTLDDINRAWPRFLQEARRISMRSSVMMEKAYPSGIEGTAIVITFTARANHDMMSQPKQQEFVRTLLALCLGRGKKPVPVRFVLAADATIDRGVEREIVRHDPRAKLEALAENGVGQESVAFAAPPTHYAPAPVYTPPPRPVPVEQDDLEPPPPVPLQKRGQNANNRAQEQHAKAMADPFVQEILQVFGGEVIVE
jgi:DNA polymerase-3 subunit gamma/tau